MITRRAENIEKHVKVYKRNGAVPMVDDNKYIKEWYFHGFLQSICEIIIGELAHFFSLQGGSNDLRCHVRFYNNGNGKGEKAGDKQEEYIACNKSYGGARTDELRSGSLYWTPSSIKWDGSLIQGAFRAKKPLLYEVNKDVSIPPRSHWNNFLTFIPNFSGNYKHDANESKIRPYFSMGIASSKEEYNDYLRLFEFARIDNIIGATMDDVLMNIELSPHGFVEYLIKKQSESEDSK